MMLKRNRTEGSTKTTRELDQEDTGNMFNEQLDIFEIVRLVNLFRIKEKAHSLVISVTHLRTDGLAERSIVYQNLSF